MLVITDNVMSVFYCYIKVPPTPVISCATLNSLHHSSTYSTLHISLYISIYRQSLTVPPFMLKLMYFSLPLLPELRTFSGRRWVAPSFFSTWFLPPWRDSMKSFRPRTSSVHPSQPGSALAKTPSIQGTGRVWMQGRRPDPGNKRPSTTSESYT